MAQNHLILSHDSKLVQICAFMTHCQVHNYILIAFLVFLAYVGFRSSRATALFKSVTNSRVNC
jgi:hypothetical protein